MSNERDLNQRSMGCIGLSALLHAIGLIVIATLPMWASHEDVKPELAAGAANSSNGSDTVFMDIKGEAKILPEEPKPEEAKLPEKVAVNDTTATPVQSEPVVEAPPAVEPLPEKKAPAPKKINKKAKIKAAPVVVAPVEPPDEIDVQKAIADAHNEKPADIVAQAEPVAETVEPPVEPVQDEAPQKLAEAPDVNPAPEAEAAKTAQNEGAGTSEKSARGEVAPGLPTEGEIKDGGLLSQVPGNPQPHYPERDRFAHNQGTAVFLAFVRPDGSVEQVVLEKSTSSRSLDEAAVSAFKKWKFKSGQSSWIRQPFTFSLNGEEVVPARLHR